VIRGNRDVRKMYENEKKSSHGRIEELRSFSAIQNKSA
jgi:hypothetical protein